MLFGFVVIHVIHCRSCNYWSTDFKVMEKIVKKTLFSYTDLI